jgi:hypothetical protein
MNKIKSIFIAVFILLNLVAVTQTQAQSTMQKLTAKTWIYQVPAAYTQKFSLSMTLKYSTTTENGTMILDGVTTSLSRAYYLSDIIETSFDNSKIGNVQNGKYLIISTQGTSFDVFEILTLNTIKFSFKHIRSGTVSNFVTQLPNPKNGLDPNITPYD